MKEKIRKRMRLRKALAVVLSISMMLGLLPLGAGAQEIMKPYDGLQQAVVARNPGTGEAVKPGQISEQEKEQTREASKAVAEHELESAIEAAAEQAPETSVERVAEHTPETAAEPATEQAPEPATEPAAETESEYESESEAVPEPETELPEETRPVKVRAGLANGTYSITANLSMPGEYNPVISGTTVYASNPNNPFGPTIDENDPAEVSDAIPNTPLADNAQLVVTKQGEKYLLLRRKKQMYSRRADISVNCLRSFAVK